MKSKILLLAVISTLFFSEIHAQEKEAIVLPDISNAINLENKKSKKETMEIKEEAREISSYMHPELTVDPANSYIIKTYDKHDAVVQEAYNEETNEKCYIVVKEDIPIKVALQFKKYLHNKEFYCYGIPVEDFITHKCKYCGETYTTQVFKYVGYNDGEVFVPEKETRFVSGVRNCPKSRTGACDDIIVHSVQPCGDPKDCESLEISNGELKRTSKKSLNR